MDKGADWPNELFVIILVRCFILFFLLLAEFSHAMKRTRRRKFACLSYIPFITYVLVNHLSLVIQTFVIFFFCSLVDFEMRK